MSEILLENWKYKTFSKKCKYQKLLTKRKKYKTKQNRKKKQNKIEQTLELFFNGAKNMSNGLIIKFMCKFDGDEIRIS